KAFLEHGDLMKGGELVFTMGAQPNRIWGRDLGFQSISKITEPAIVAVPVIKAESKAFKNQLTISLQPQTNVHYTTDGTEPSQKSKRFLRPFVIDRNTTVKAVTIDARGRSSAVVTGTFHRIPHDWKLSLLTRYSSQYPASGDSAVIDGLRGTMNWSGGAWQGYWETDFTAVVDLGKIQRLTKVGAGFLQDIGSWIWFPRRVEIELSKDGKSFTPAASIAFTSDATTIKDFVQTITPQDARFVRFRALNSGKNTWIFVDEILIEN
ncbi:MAG TPA: FN3 associated domain-containing protein, partial [Pyrinomonadaceae bacterium]